MKYFRILFLPAVLSWSACSDFSWETEVALLCPPPPAAWQIAFPGLGFRVVTRDASGAARESEVPDWRIPSAVTCAKGINSTILAWPYEPGNPQSAVHQPGLLRPAGGFFPLSLRAFGDREVVQLTWEEGAAALVVFRVAALGRDMSLFNVSRLCRFFREAGEPWALDLDSIGQKIALGDFSARDIDFLPSRSAEVEPGPGTWFLESPFDSPRESVMGKVLLSRCARGMHRLFSLAGPSWKLEVGENGTFLLPVQEERADHLQKAKSTPSTPQTTRK